MTTPLLDLATRPPSGPRCLVHAESDRARSGTSVAVLLADPGGTSPHWPLALAAYRQIWSRYKAHTPVVGATELLAEVAADLAAKRDLVISPDLVIALVTVDGAAMAAWALPTALVLVRQGDEPGELGPQGFHAVPAAGSLARATEGSGIWHGRIEVETGMGFCVVAREAAARMGLWRLREALGAPAGDAILKEMGVGEEPVIAGHLLRTPDPGVRHEGERPPVFAELTGVGSTEVPAGASRSPAPAATASVAASEVAAASDVAAATEMAKESVAETPVPSVSVDAETPAGEERAPGSAAGLEREPAFSVGGEPSAPVAGSNAEAPIAEGTMAEETMAMATSTAPASSPDSNLLGRRPVDSTVAETIDGGAERAGHRRSADEGQGRPEGTEAGEGRGSVMLRGRRRYRDPRQTSWLSQPESSASRNEVGPFAASDAPTAAPSARDSVEILPPFGQRDVLVDSASDAGGEGDSGATGLPFTESGAAPISAADLPDESASGSAPGFVLAGRRSRYQTETNRLRSLFASMDYSPTSGRGRSGSESFLLRRWLTWAVLGLSLVLTLAMLILIGRFLVGGGPEGPEVEGLVADGGATLPAEVPPPPAPPLFSGASWAKNLTKAVTSSPLVLDDQVIVGCRDGHLYSFALSDGAERWRFAAGAGMGSSASSFGSLVAIGTYAGDVVGVDAESGSERWRYRTGGRIVSSPAFHAAGLLAIGSNDRHIYGLGATGGELKWKVPTGGIVWASPVITGNQVIVGSHDHFLYCLDAMSGRVEWKAETGGPISSTAAVWRDRAVVGSADGRAYAFSLADGQRLWSQRLGAKVDGSVIAAEDLVLVGTDAGDLVALRAEDGVERYRLRTGGAVKCRPAVAEGRTWFTSYDGGLRVAELASGKELWSFQAEGRLYSSPAVLGRTAFFGSLNGKLYAATWPEDS
jgi:outer membrane protein assembly factor BamB